MIECDLEIQKAIQSLHTCFVEDGAQRVSTSCLYPGGELVTLSIYKTSQGFCRVTDDANALETLVSYGVDINQSHIKQASHLAQARGMLFDTKRQQFSSSEVHISQLEAAIIFLSNTIQEFVGNITANISAEKERTLKNLLHDKLANEIRIPKHALTKDYELTGQSNKKYTFGNAIIINDISILIEAVSNHQNSIAPTYLKLQDVHERYPEYKREAVISKPNEWSAPNYNIVRSVFDNINEFEKNISPMLDRYGL